MASVNKVILMGNAGRDAEVRYLPDGKAVANVSIATSMRRKDKTTGEIIEDTQWHRVTLYDRLAEIAGEYVTKGKSIYVEGRIKYGVYTDKNTGVEKNTVDIVATELQLLGSKPDNAGQQQQARPAAAPAPSQRPAPAPQQRHDNFDDSDVPF